MAAPRSEVQADLCGPGRLPRQLQTFVRERRGDRRWKYRCQSMTSFGVRVSRQLADTARAECLPAMRHPSAKAGHGPLRLRG
jgi:hypothetical protein